MQLTLTINPLDPSDLNRSIALLARHREALLVTGEASAPAADPKPEKSEPKPEKSEPKPKPEKSEPKPKPEKPEPGLDYAKDVAPAVTALLAAKGRDVTVGVLAQFGAKKADQVPADKWADLINACNEAANADDGVV